MIQHELMGALHIMTNILYLHYLIHLFHIFSGDIGHYDENCDFYVVDRVKELIKYNAYQVLLSCGN